MEQTTLEALAALLTQAGGAHGVYEESELGGVYDQNWPSWYATYLVQHGIGELLNAPTATEQLASLLAQYDAAYKREQPSQGWPTFYARQLLAAANGSPTTR